MPRSVRLSTPLRADAWATRTNCGYELILGSTRHLPPCPSCSNGEYATVTGGDAADDPYPGAG